MSKRDSSPLTGSVRMWHPWQDSPGMRYLPSLLCEGEIALTGDYKRYPARTTQQMVDALTKRQLFTLCTDILSPRDVPYGNELLGVKGVTPYLSRAGKMAAMSVKQSRTYGYLIPASSWCWDAPPTQKLLDNLTIIFALLGFQSTTPASASEKLFKFTLPDRAISRPSIPLRDCILANHQGGLIIKAEEATFYPCVYEYDKNKAYLDKSRWVPSPYLSPIIHGAPIGLDELFSYAMGFWDCELVGVKRRIPPIQKNGVGAEDGEVIRRWLWSGELADCIDAGYQVIKVHGGYGWREMSNLMEEWADILWQIYQIAEHLDPHIRKVIKQMMVGLPGRFLRAPETYRLIPIEEIVSPPEGKDIPLRMHWLTAEDAMFSDWAIRPEYDKNCTALTPIGSFIVAEMRRELYHRMLAEEANGNRVLRAYIDCYATEKPTTLGEIGTGLGQYKEKKYWNTYVWENRFIGVTLDAEGKELAEMKAPGVAAENHLPLWRKYHQIVAENEFRTTLKTHGKLA